MKILIIGTLAAMPSALLTTTAPRPTIVAHVEPDKQDTAFDDALLLLKAHEGLKLQAYPDAGRYSIGWGTPSRAGQTVTVRQADRLCAAAFRRVVEHTAKLYPWLDRRAATVLAVTLYNVGSLKGRAHAAAKRGDTATLAALLPLYNKSGGKVLDGLTKRRRAEAALLLGDRTSIKQYKQTVKTYKSSCK